MSLAALIPARGGSKGVPRKNIRILNGYPLLAFSIAACYLSKNIDRVIVSTDDKEIADIARRYGAEVPFYRPSKYATDTATDLDVLAHFFTQVDIEEVAFIRPTTPLREPNILDNIIDNYFKNKDDCTGFRSMHELPESPYKTCKIENGYCRGFFEDFNGIKDYMNLPRQLFPKAYQPNGYIDIVKKSTVLCGEDFGEKIIPYVTDFVLEIDVEFQFDMIENQLKKNKNILLDFLENYDFN